MKRAFLLFALFLLPTIAKAQTGFQWHDIVLGQSGRGVSGVTVTVCPNANTIGTTPCVNPVVIYTDGTLGTITPNPFLTDSLGNWRFWAPGACYIVYTSGRNTVTTGTQVCLGGAGGGVGPSVTSFGATCTGNAHDDTAGFNAALASLAATGGTISVPPSALGCNIALGNVQFPTGVFIVLAGTGPGSLIKMTSGATAAFTVAGSPSTVANITSDAAVGDLTLTVASTTGIVAANWISVQDTTVPCLSSSNCQQEMVQVESVQSGTVLNLKTSLIRAYSHLSGTTTKFAPAFVTFKDLTIDSSGQAAAVILAQYAVNFTMDNVTLTGGNATPNNRVQILFSERWQVRNSHCYNFTGALATGQQACWAIEASNHGTFIDNDCWKAGICASLGAQASWNKVVTSQAHGITNEGFDVHQSVGVAMSSDHNSFIGNNCDAAGWFASNTPSTTCITIQAGTGNAMIGNTASGYVTPIFQVATDSGHLMTPQNTTVEGNDATLLANGAYTEGANPTFDIHGIFGAVMNGVIANNNKVHGIAASSEGLQLSYVNNASANGNEVDDSLVNTLTTCIEVINSTAVTITGNNTSGCASAGIRLDGTSSNINIGGNTDTGSGAALLVAGGGVTNYGFSAPNFSSTAAGTGFVNYSNTGTNNFPTPAAGVDATGPCTGFGSPPPLCLSNGTGAGEPFILNGGQSFGVNQIIGSVDNFPLIFKVHNSNAMTLTSNGTLTLLNTIGSYSGETLDTTGGIPVLPPSCKIGLQNQGAAIASTALCTPTVAGFYTIFVTVQIATGGGTGTILPSISYTGNDTSVGSEAYTEAGITTISNATANLSQTTVFQIHWVSGAINYSTTDSNAATSKYNIYIRVIQDW